jgi:lipopolysaccharide export system permease protein
MRIRPPSETPDDPAAFLEEPEDLAFNGAGRLRASGGNGAGDGAAAKPSTRQRPPVRRPIGFGDVVWFLPRLVLRILFPKLFDRYVMGELFGPLLFGWTLFLILFVFAVELFKLAQYAARGADPHQIGEMLWLKVILSSVYCLPMAMLLSGLLAFGRLSGESELIATQAGGIPNLRALRNVFLLGLALSFVGVYLNENIIPPAGKRFHFLEDQVKTILKGKLLEEVGDTKAFVIQDYEGGKLARLVVAKKLTPERPPDPARLEDVTYIQYEKGEWSTIVQARRAEWLKQRMWRFIDADTQLRHSVTNDQRFFMHSETLDLELNKTPQQIAKEQREADQMTYNELKDYIQQLKAQKMRGKVIRELEVDLELKRAVPFAAVVFALIGAPLGIRRQRSTAGVGIGLSLLIIILYYVLMSFLGALGTSGQIEALHAAWGANAVGLIAGIILVLRSSR